MIKCPYGTIRTIAFIILVVTSVGVTHAIASNIEVDETPMLQIAGPAEPISVQERAILDFTNKERIKLGLTPLLPSSALMSVARKHSQHMCDAKILKHESDVFPSGWQKFDQRIKNVKVFSGGENIAYHSKLKDPEKWADLVVKGWMKSKEHKKNIVNREYRFLGVGVSQCTGSIEFVTQVFSQERGVFSSTKTQVKIVPVE